MSPRTRWITLDDGTLLAECRVDTYRASGPGGQKRNKTSSAVRLRHEPSGLQVIAEESRSQHENKARALRRLRLSFALNLREPIDETWQPPAVFARRRTPAGRIEVSRRHADYSLIVACVLDAVEARGGRLKEAADLLGLTTAQLSAFITSDGKTLDRVNRSRRDAGLKPLR